MCTTITPQNKIYFIDKTKTQINRYNYLLEFENFRENVNQVQMNKEYGSPSTMTMLGVDGYLKNWICELYPRGLKNYNKNALYFVIWRADATENIDNLDIQLSILDYEMKKVRMTHGTTIMKNKRIKTNFHDFMLPCEYLISPIQLNEILDP